MQVIPPYKRIGLTTLIIFFLTLMVSWARAGTLTVVNPGFETGDLTGWSSIYSGGYGSGSSVVNNTTNQSAQYPNFPPTLPGTASGTYYASVCGYNGNPAQILYQDVSANGKGNGTLQPNTTYTLTMAIGEGDYSSPNNGFIELINGTAPTSGTVLATANVSTLGYGYYADNFKDLTVTFTTGSSVSGDLTVAVGTTYGYPNSTAMFVDNVRLTAVTTTSPTVTVVNPGFETGDLTGWSSIYSGGYGSGSSVVNNTTNQSAQYPNFPPTLPGTASGTYYASVCGYNGNPAQILYQDVSANGKGNGTLQPNTTYTLTMAIGEGDYSSPNNGFIELINGTAPTSGTVLATANVSTLGYGYYADNFKDLTVTFTTGSSVSGDLTVAVGTTYGYPNSTAMFVDNVRLTRSTSSPPETIGGGTIASPAVGPAQSFGIGGTGFTLVKNWHFGADGTIRNITDLNANFMYHDQFGTYNNGNGQYGSNIVAPDTADALSGQPIEGTNTGGLPVRTFFTDSLRTYLVPLNGATTVSVTTTAAAKNCGSGSFEAKFTLPNGGTRLNQDIIWETRVRYVTPPYFWFSIWNCGNPWQSGAEMDLVESFGYDNGGGYTNYNGAYWHSNSVSGSDQVNYNNGWSNGMSSVGINSFDATQYHIWDLAYYKDGTYAFYVDGVKVQYGSQPYNWTVGASPSGQATNMSFIFNGDWGNTQVSGVDNKSLPASQLSGTYYEWNYSRIYLR